MIWSGLQRRRSCHINEMTPLPVLQLRCHCNPDHNKFSSLSNIQLWCVKLSVVFQNFCSWYWPWKTLSSHLDNVELSILSPITTVFTHPPKRSVVSSSEAFNNSKKYPFTIDPHNSIFTFHCNNCALYFS